MQNFNFEEKVKKLVVYDDYNERVLSLITFGATLHECIQ